MKKKRINDIVLASIPVQNGQILKGEHLAILREILVAGINENKYDIDRIVAGQDAVHVYGENEEALYAYASENHVDDETLGYLHTGNQIFLYTYLENTNTWIYLGVLNLTKLFNKVQELEVETRQVGETIITYQSGVVVSMTSDNVVESIEYDVNGEVEKVISTYADGKVYEETYTKDVNGNITKIMKVEAI